MGLANVSSTFAFFVAAPFATRSRTHFRSIFGPCWGNFWCLFGHFWRPEARPFSDSIPDRKKWPKGAPLVVSGGHSGAPRAPKGPKRGPKSLPNRSSKAFQHRSRKRECPDQSDRSIWADLGAHVELMVGLRNVVGGRIPIRQLLAISVGQKPAQCLSWVG